VTQRNLSIVLSVLMIAVFISPIVLDLVILTGGLPGLSGSLSVEKNFTGDQYEYLETEDEVQHPHWRSHYQNGERINYSVPKVVPAKQWSEEECMNLARSKLADTVKNRVERVSSMDGIIFGTSSYSQLSVIHEVLSNREGEVINRPEIDYQKLVSLTPGKINCTVYIDGQTYSNVVEVTVEKSRSQRL